MWRGWAAWLGVPAQDFLTALKEVIAKGEHHRAVFERFRPGFDVAAARRERAAVGESDMFEARDLYADAVPCLRQLRARGYRIGIAGNQPEGAAGVLASFDLAVEFIASSASLGVEKPAVVVLRQACGACGLSRRTRSPMWAIGSTMISCRHAPPECRPCTCCADPGPRSMRAGRKPPWRMSHWTTLSDLADALARLDRIPRKSMSHGEGAVGRSRRRDDRAQARDPGDARRVERGRHRHRVARCGARARGGGRGRHRKILRLLRGDARRSGDRGGVRRAAQSPACRMVSEGDGRRQARAVREADRDECARGRAADRGARAQRHADRGSVPDPQSSAMGGAARADRQRRNRRGARRAGADVLPQPQSRRHPQQARDRRRRALRYWQLCGHRLPHGVRRGADARARPVRARSRFRHRPARECDPAIPRPGRRRS